MKNRIYMRYTHFNVFNNILEKSSCYAAFTEPTGFYKIHRTVCKKKNIL